VCCATLTYCRADAWKESVAFTAFILVGLVGVCNLFSGAGYSAYTDTDTKTYQGDCNIGEGDTEESVVRELYRYGSYNMSKTDWPVRLMFAIFGALSLAAVARPGDSLIRTATLALAVILLVQLWSQAFTSVHGDIQAQIRRDSLYCKYNVLRYHGNSEAPRH
jgi:hypothetical protein